MKIFILLLTLLAGCTSTTVIRSHPMGASVYIDGQLVGKTPYEHTDRKMFYQSSDLKIVKKGYQEFDTQLKRSQEWDYGAIIGFFSLPWCRKYQKEQYYELKP
ncbi:MAG: PEGA domain-containing protein [Bdellovibrionales bacterium]|nr:PEGA domain-containing protein [Bdellovibrionales bacterium]